MGNTNHFNLLETICYWFHVTFPFNKMSLNFIINFTKTENNGTFFPEYDIQLLFEFNLIS
jgi:hypothetical protein